jgi:hypothetical protein
MMLDYLQTIQPAQIFTGFLVFVSHTVIVSAISVGAMWVVSRLFQEDTFSRCLAVISALIAYFLARALKLSLADVVFESLADSPSKLWLFLTAFFLPALSGVITTILIGAGIERGGEVGNRLSLFVMTLAILMFTDVYVEAFGHSSGLDRQLAPNTAFVLGMAMFFVLLPNRILRVR